MSTIITKTGDIQQKNSFNVLEVLFEEGMEIVEKVDQDAEDKDVSVIAGDEGPGLNSPIPYG